MELNLFTAYVSFSINTLFTTLLLVPLWLHYRKKYGEIKFWALKATLLFIGNLAMLLRPGLPEVAGRMFPVIFWYLSGIMFLTGIQKFYGVSTNVRKHIILALIGVGAISWFWYGNNWFNMRLALIYGIIGIQNIQVLYSILFKKREKKKFVTPLIIGVMFHTFCLFGTLLVNVFLIFDHLSYLY